MIYSVDSVIHALNNRGLVVEMHCESKVSHPRTHSCWPGLKPRLLAVTIRLLYLYERSYSVVILVRKSLQSTVRKKMSAVQFTTVMHQTNPTRHMERYGLMAAVSTLTALLLSSLNDLQFFFVFLFAVLGFLCAKHYR